MPPFVGRDSLDTTGLYAKLVDLLNDLPQLANEPSIPRNSIVQVGELDRFYLCHTDLLLIWVSHILGVWVRPLIGR